MGVPALFRWLSKKYPRIVAPVVEEEPRKVPSGKKVKRVSSKNGLDDGADAKPPGGGGDGGGHEEEEAEEEEDMIELPIDMSKPNPNGEEFDCLYLDMNGIVHPCTHPEGKPAPETEEDMMLEIFAYTERVVNMVRPRRLLMMAIDGVAPRAKMNQQRSRRFRAAQEAKEKEEDRVKALEEWKAMGLPITEDALNQKKPWDSNAITPGTPFMDLLASSLRYWVAKKMVDDPGWKGLQVLISDASVPGEGEHKIMDFIRRQRSHASHDPNTKHVIYGLDADLIMLSLATHEPHFKVLREDVFAQDAKPRGCHRCGKEGHIAANCIGEAREKSGTHDEVAPKKPERKPFIFLDVCVLREYLEVELDVPGLPFAFDLERAIDDWVFLIFFVGNDFLPHLPSLEIREGAIDNLLRIWKAELPRMGGYLTKHGKVELKHAEYILHGIAVMEDDIFRRRKEAEERQDANTKRRKIEDEDRQRAEMRREGKKVSDVRHGEHDYVEVTKKGSAAGNGAVVVKSETGASDDSNELKAKAIEALSSGDPGKVIDNQRAIRMANLSAAERLKAELAGKSASAKREAGDISADAKPAVKAEQDTDAVLTIKKEDQVDGSAELAAGEGDAEGAANGVVKSEEGAPADASTVFKMDEETDPSVGAEAAPKRALKRAIEEVEGDTTREGDEKDEEDVGAGAAGAGEEEEIDPVTATNFERKVRPDGTVEYEDTVKLWEPGYRERYYRQKFGVELSDDDFRRKLVKSYVEGLCWVLAYYYQGCPSWTWYYPYHFSPFAADFTDLASLDIHFDQGTPFRPFDQLMGVLPAASRASIPPIFHPLMTEQDSEIIDFYPETFSIDMNGKKMAWQGVALLPFIDETRLLNALEKRYPQLTDDEERRNAFGDNMLLVSDEHRMSDLLCALYAKRKSDGPLEVDPDLSGGISGQLRPDSGFVPGTTYDSPLTRVGLEDIMHNRAMVALYDFPAQRTPHRSVLLKGVKPPRRVLSASEREATRRGRTGMRGGGGDRGRGRGGHYNGGASAAAPMRMGSGPMATGATPTGPSSYGASPASSWGSYGGSYRGDDAYYGGGGGHGGGGGSQAGYYGGAGYGGGYGAAGGASAQAYGGYGGQTSASGYGGYGGGARDPYAGYAQAHTYGQTYGAPAAHAMGNGVGRRGGHGGRGGYSGGAAPSAAPSWGGYGGGAGGAYASPSAAAYGGYPASGGAYAGYAGYGGGGSAAAGYGGQADYGGYSGYGGYGAGSAAQRRPGHAATAAAGPPQPLGYAGGAPPSAPRSGGRGGRGGAGGPYGRY